MGSSSIFPQIFSGWKKIQKIFEKLPPPDWWVGWVVGFFQGLPLLSWLTQPRSSACASQWTTRPRAPQTCMGKKNINEKTRYLSKISGNKPWKKAIFFLFHMISHDDLDTTFAFSWWIFQFLLERKGSGLMLPFHEPRYLIVNMSLEFFNN